MPAENINSISHPSFMSPQNQAVRKEDRVIVAQPTAIPEDKRDNFLLDYQNYQE
jgi:hypothetical protein